MFLLRRIHWYDMASITLHLTFVVVQVVNVTPKSTFVPTLIRAIQQLKCAPMAHLKRCVLAMITTLEMSVNIKCVLWLSA